MEPQESRVTVRVRESCKRRYTDAAWLSEPAKATTRAASEAAASESGIAAPERRINSEATAPERGKSLISQCRSF